MRTATLQISHREGGQLYDWIETNIAAATNPPRYPNYSTASAYNIIRHMVIKGAEGWVEYALEFPDLTTDLIYYRNEREIQ